MLAKGAYTICSTKHLEVSAFIMERLDNKNQKCISAAFSIFCKLIKCLPY